MNTMAHLTLGALAAALLGMTTAGAADEPGVKETIKRDAVEFGHEVKKAAKVVARESRAAGQSIKQGTRKAAHAVAEGAHDAKQKIAGSKPDTTK